MYSGVQLCYNGYVLFTYHFMVPCVFSYLPCGMKELDLTLRYYYLPCRTVCRLAVFSMTPQIGTVISVRFRILVIDGFDDLPN